MKLFTPGLIGAMVRRELSLSSSTAKPAEDRVKPPETAAFARSAVAPLPNGTLNVTAIPLRITLLMIGPSGPGFEMPRSLAIGR